MNVELGCLPHELPGTSFFCFLSAGVVGTPEFDVGVGKPTHVYTANISTYGVFPQPHGCLLVVVIVVVVWSVVLELAL